MNNDKDLEQLEALLPVAKEITVNGVTVDVSPLKLGEIVKVIKPLKQLRTYFKDEQAFSQTALELLSSDDAELVLDALAVLVRQPRAWVDDLGVDDAVDILSAVITNNVDVFQKKILPAIQTLAMQTATQVSAVSQ